MSHLVRRAGARLADPVRERFAARVSDVCFVHWPIELDVLAARLPPGLDPATRDGSAWVSVLAQRTGPLFAGVPTGPEFVQVTLRTYVRPREDEGDDGDGDRTDDLGVFFVRVQAGSYVGVAAARRLYGVDYHYADSCHRWEEGRLRVRVADAGGRPETLLFGLDAEPRGSAQIASPDSTAGWLAEQYRYYLADGRRGTVAHRPWPLYEADGTVHAEGLFERAGFPEPESEPLLRYSPGVVVRLLEAA